jgi:hypothetical protein
MRRTTPASSIQATQITQLVEHAHGAMDFPRALLVLVPIWWMYAVMPG